MVIVRSWSASVRLGPSQGFYWTIRHGRFRVDNKNLSELQIVLWSNLRWSKNTINVFTKLIYLDVIMRVSLWIIWTAIFGQMSAGGHFRPGPWLICPRFWHVRSVWPNWHWVIVLLRWLLNDNLSNFKFISALTRSVVCRGRLRVV